MIKKIKNLFLRKRKPRPASKHDPWQQREDEEQAAYLEEWSSVYERGQFPIIGVASP